MNKSVSAVLYTYKQPDVLPEQVERITNQTVDVDEIVVVHTENEMTDDFPTNAFKIVYRKDFGLQTKFTSALCCNSDFVWVIDDDIMPGEKALENLLESFDERRGLYGALGFDVNEDGSYEHYGGYEVSKGQHDYTVKVDHVGQSYFGPKEYFGYFFVDQPDIDVFSGMDDIWMAHQLQKHGIDCLVPPYPVDEMDKWVCQKVVHDLDVAICQREGHKDDRKRIIQYCIDRGWDV